MKVLKLFLKTASQNKVIARELNISEATVKIHLRTVFRLAGVAGRSEAILAFYQGKLAHLFVTEKDMTEAEALLAESALSVEESRRTQILAYHSKIEAIALAVEAYSTATSQIVDETQKILGKIRVLVAATDDLAKAVKVVNLEGQA